MKSVVKEFEKTKKMVNKLLVEISKLTVTNKDKPLVTIRPKE